MQNKLKDVFSNKKYEFGGSLSFKDSKSKDTFIQALKTMESEGRAVNIDGVTKFSISIKNGDLSYPFLVENDISNVTVSPSIKLMPIIIDTEYGEKVINMETYPTKNGFVFKTENKEMVFLKFDCDINNGTINFVYRMQPEFAAHLKEMIEKITAALALINSIFPSDHTENMEYGSDAVTEIKKYLQTERTLLNKMHKIEAFFNIEFDTSKISGLSAGDIRDIEELYTLIIEKKAVRLNGKLTTTGDTGIKFRPNAKIPKMGANLDITFTNTVIYSICGQNITIYTANILLNAVVKKILTDDNGETKVLYSDEDRKPMYISYTGFKTEDEAKQEFKVLMQNKQKYVDALIVA